MIDTTAITLLSKSREESRTSRVNFGSISKVEHSGEEEDADMSDMISADDLMACMTQKPQIQPIQRVAHLQPPYPAPIFRAPNQ